MTRRCRQCGGSMAGRGPRAHTCLRPECQAAQREAQLTGRRERERRKYQAAKEAGAALPPGAPRFDGPATVPMLWPLSPAKALVPQLRAELESRKAGGDRAAARQLELLGRAA